MSLKSWRNTGTRWSCIVNTLRPRQNGRHFADDTFEPIFLNENIRISIKISLKFVPKVPINSIPALVQIIAWRRPGEKPLSEPMMVSLLTHICVNRPQWVNTMAVDDLVPISLRLMMSQLKDIASHTKIKVSKMHILRCMVQNFVWNFKDTLWNFTQILNPYTTNYVFHEVLKCEESWYLRVMIS